jgi:hypothetical protein
MVEGGNLLLSSFVYGTAYDVIQRAEISQADPVFRSRAFSWSGKGQREGGAHPDDSTPSSSPISILNAFLTSSPRRTRPCPTPVISSNASCPCSCESAISAVE